MIANIFQLRFSRKKKQFVGRLYLKKKKLLITLCRNDVI